MIRVYHASGSRSLRVVWLLEELAVPYELEKLDLSPASIKTPDYLAKNPLGKIPTLEYDGQPIFESGAIVQYLLERHDAAHTLHPSVADASRGPFLAWFHWAEASAMSPLSDYIGAAMRTPEDQRSPFAIGSARKRLGFVKNAIQDQLAERDYILGDAFSAADIMLGFFCHLATMIGQLDDSHPKVCAYYARLAERPAFQKATAS